MSNMDLSSLLPSQSSVETAPIMRARLLDRVGDHPLQIDNLLSPKEQDELRGISKLVEYRPGTPIFSNGAEAQYVYVVSEGIIRITRIAPNGQRRILAFMLAGDLFGMPDCGIYVNSSESITAAKLYKISWPALRKLMATDPQLQRSFMIKLAYDFRQAQRQMMMLGQQSAHHRLALFLLDFMRDPCFFDKESLELRLPVNRLDIADFLGTTRETAARAFARLETDGLLQRLNPQTVRILNLKGLRQLQFGPCRPPCSKKARKQVISSTTAEITDSGTAVVGAVSSADNE
jgi:CRP-like cAMP-binding protein